MGSRTDQSKRNVRRISQSFINQVIGNVRPTKYDREKRPGLSEIYGFLRGFSSDFQGDNHGKFSKHGTPFGDIYNL